MNISEDMYVTLLGESEVLGYIPQQIPIQIGLQMDITGCTIFVNPISSEITVLRPILVYSCNERLVVLTSSNRHLTDQFPVGIRRQCGSSVVHQGSRPKSCPVAVAVLKRNKAPVVKDGLMHPVRVFYIALHIL